MQWDHVQGPQLEQVFQDSSTGHALPRLPAVNNIRLDDLVALLVLPVGCELGAVDGFIAGLEGDVELTEPKVSIRFLQQCLATI